MTSPAARRIDSATASYNFLEQMIQREAQATRTSLSDVQSMCVERAALFERC